MGIRKVFFGVLLIAASFFIPTLIPHFLGSVIGMMLMVSGIFLALYDIIILGK